MPLKLPNPVENNEYNRSRSFLDSLGGEAYAMDQDLRAALTIPVEERKTAIIKVLKKFKCMPSIFSRLFNVPFYSPKFNYIIYELLRRDCTKDVERLLVYPAIFDINVAQQAIARDHGPTKDQITKSIKLLYLHGDEQQYAYTITELIRKIIGYPHGLNYIGWLCDNHLLPKISVIQTLFYIDQSRANNNINNKSVTSLLIRYVLSQWGNARTINDTERQAFHLLAVNHINKITSREDYQSDIFSQLIESGLITADKLPKIAFKQYVRLSQDSIMDYMHSAENDNIRAWCMEMLNDAA